MIYLAVDYGMEGWKLMKFASAEEALEYAMSGNVYGPWKIFKQLIPKIEDDYFKPETVGGML